jgi:hypothetical protein
MLHGFARFTLRLKVVQGPAPRVLRRPWSELYIRSGLELIIM